MNFQKGTKGKLPNQLSLNLSWYHQNTRFHTTAILEEGILCLLDESYCWEDPLRENYKAMRLRKEEE